MKTFDIAIIGSGFGGSLLAMVAKRLGRSVILLERGQHPRFVIGESSTPLTNLLLEELAREYDLPRLLPLTKWGTWQAAHPEIGCGLKRGFTFYHHRFGKSWSPRCDRENELLVAASPHDGISDTHWYRPDFDHFLVREAQAQGVEYIDRITLAKPENSPSGVILSGERDGKPLRFQARFLVDASGGRGFLHRAYNLSEQNFFRFPATQALYTHFTDVRRIDELYPRSEPPPYAPDDAALHHVFDGGWIWVLRFNNGITSAGVAATDSLAKGLRLHEGAPAWERLLERLPSVGEQFGAAKAQFPFVYTPRLPFRSASAAGPFWALLPSAAGIIDPLLSTGFPLTLLGIRRLGRILQRDWASEGFTAALGEYERQTFKDLDTAAMMVAALYANMNDFPLFSRLSLLYFAAVSFTESARRLCKPNLAGGSFLLGDNASFAKQSASCLLQALQPLEAREKERLKVEISRTIEPFDIAGLRETNRRNWYPVSADDLFEGAPKLSASEEEIGQLLARCGFNPERR